MFSFYWQTRCGFSCSTPRRWNRTRPAYATEPNTDSNPLLSVHQSLNVYLYMMFGLEAEEERGHSIEFKITEKPNAYTGITISGTFTHEELERLLEDYQITRKKVRDSSFE